MSIIKVKNNGVWQEVSSMSKHTHAIDDITNFPSSLPANGGNADTLDGKHASDFATVFEMKNVQTGINNAVTDIAYNGDNLTYTNGNGSVTSIPMRNSWTLVQDVTVSEEVGYLFFDRDSSGNELKTKNYTKAYLLIETTPQETEIGGELQAFINLWYEGQTSRPRASAGNTFIKNTSKQYWKAQFDIDNALCLFGLKGIADEGWSDTINGTPDSYKLFTQNCGGLFTKPGFVNNIKIQAPIGIPVGTKIKIWMR